MRTPARTPLRQRSIAAVDPLLPTRAIVAETNYSYNTVLTYIRSGALPAVRHGKAGWYRVRRSALDKFINDHTVVPREKGANDAA
jgi:hypothetical protein